MQATVTNKLNLAKQKLERRGTEKDDSGSGVHVFSFTSQTTRTDAHMISISKG